MPPWNIKAGHVFPGSVIILLTACYGGENNLLPPTELVDDREHVKKREMIQFWMIACGNSSSYSNKVSGKINVGLISGEAVLKIALSEGLDEHLKLFPESQRAQVKKDYIECINNKYEDNARLTVVYDREYDMTKVGGIDEKGDLIYEELYEDKLIFSHPPDTYEVQHYISTPENTSSLYYKYKGKFIAAPESHIEHTDQDSRKKFYSVSVEGKELILKHHFTQRNVSANDTWGIGVASSLPISGFSAKVILPEGKKVCSADKTNKLFNDVFKKGCQEMTFGSKPIIRCNKSFDVPKNTSVNLPWIWDIWESCP